MASLKVKSFAKLLNVENAFCIGTRAMSGISGSGAGKGGGSGGSVRDAGGSLGKREAAQEDQYFRKLQQEQLANLHKHLEDEIAQHELQIKQHEQSIKKHKETLASLRKQ
ncbi:ATPase inhibitor mai-1, mitochondrial [Galendromus occidentalis]|uniref:ATP synthase F1 subunit epsilon n=1 Tax=Galendromus occidentalis TaxID=34638 RepID=A0AAJ6QVX6_9ACAR|nr:ATPase inhibitor mai-1, mitochondrial [Galendromus occidentalis]